MTKKMALKEDGLVTKVLKKDVAEVFPEAETILGLILALSLPLMGGSYRRKDEGDDS